MYLYVVLCLIYFPMVFVLLFSFNLYKSLINTVGRATRTGVLVFLKRGEHPSLLLGFVGARVRTLTDELHSWSFYLQLHSTSFIRLFL
jgi:hypothetical protein